MTITALLENTTDLPDLKCAHGLSLYIETERHKILFDAGPGEFFALNAQKLGIPVEDIDTVVISHGHADHGGGLERFLQLNSKAKIYIRRAAYEPHFSQVDGKRHIIGLDEALIDPARFVFTGAQQRIDEELLLFSEVPGTKHRSAVASALFKIGANGEEQDDFDHEQSLLITSGGHTVLIGGCAHRGIVNILEHAEELAGGPLDLAVSGFHLFNPNSGQVESEALITAIAAELKQRPTRFYTCHCTGPCAFDTLKSRMGPQIQYLSTGTVITQ